ncbi:MAG: signal peptidase II [Microbacteriaceae bacterium]|nr:signal peptidase II [Microbacteriaceae bacterium]
MTRRTLTVLTFSLAAFWIALDQLTKLWAETALVGQPRTPILGGWFGLILVYNPGAAFGLGSGFVWVLTVIAGIAVVVLIVAALRTQTFWWSIAIGSMLGGAVSHFLDRLLRGDTIGTGKIVDFIDYGGFFVGNIADIALVGAAIGSVLLSFFGVPFSSAERPKPAPKQ